MTDNDAVIVIVSRVGYDLLLREGQLIAPLRGRKLVFIHSLRTSHVAPASACHELHLIELRECNEYLAELIRAIGTRHRIDQVLTISEQDLMPVVLARHRLGFAGLSPEEATCYRDKSRMKARLVAIPGISLPGHAEMADSERARSLFRATGKVVVKPKDGYGSQDTHVVTREDELDSLLAWPVQKREGYLVEEFMHADVHHLDAVVRNGRLLFSSLGKYIVAPIDFAGRDWVGTRFSNAPGHLHEAARASLMKVLDAFGTRDGVFHYEFFFDGSRMTFGEIAIRPVGGGVADAIYDAWGVHLVEEHVRVQMGLPTTIEADHRPRHAASLLMLSSRSGIIAGFEGLSDLPEGTVRRVNLHYKEGDRIGSSRYSADSVLNCSVVAESEGALGHSIAAVQKLVRVVVQA